MAGSSPAMVRVRYCPPLEGGSKNRSVAEIFRGGETSRSPSPKFAYRKFRPSLKGRVEGSSQLPGRQMQRFIAAAESLQHRAQDAVGIQARLGVHLLRRILILEDVRQGHGPDLEATIKQAV